MKNLFTSLLLIVIVIWGKELKSQTFKLSDTSFQVGDVLIRNIVFDYNGGHVLPQSYPFLDSLVDFLNVNSKLKLEIGNHTDFRGNETYNLKLSTHRSKSVIFYLKGKKINENRLVPIGYGEGRPIIPPDEIEKMQTQEEKEDAHHTNRRTEFKIISIDFQE